MLFLYFMLKIEGMEIDLGPMSITVRFLSKHTIDMSVFVLIGYYMFMFKLTTFTDAIYRTALSSEAVCRLPSHVLLTEERFV